MANIMRIKANWTGFAGAPGVTVTHIGSFTADQTVDAQAGARALRTLLGATANFLPSVVQIRIDPEVEVLEDTTGQLQNVVNIQDEGTVTGGAAFGYAGPVGAVINWTTSSVRNGRRMRGRTFLVPLSSNAYQPDGTMDATALDTLRLAASAYWQTADILPVIYGRPTAIGTDGVAAPITSSNVPDMAAVLRSRRD